MSETKMTRFRWVMCTLLFVATTVNYLDRQVLSLTFPDFIKPEFHWTDADYGTITAWFSLIYATACLFAGKFVDWMGTKKGYQWAIFVWSLGACLHAACGIATCWFTDGIGSIAALRAVEAGSAAAASDYANPATLRDSWRTEVLSAADLLNRNLTADEKTWLDAAIDERIETVRLDTRGVQRALATRLQFALIENPEGLGEAADAGALADLIKRKSLELVKEAIGGEVLP